MAQQLQPIDLVSPGFLGLNFAQSGSLLSPQYATKAENAVIDVAGRLAARKGFLDVTTTDITANPTVKTLHEYRTSTGTATLIVAWDGGIANNVADPEGNDISGSVTDADGRWWFQDFNNKVIGFQDGQKPIVYNGAGTFATVVESSGTAPTIRGGVGLSAYGRVWGLDSDGSTIKYSALLDETTWDGASAGIIDMHNVWTDGTDEVTAIWAFNGGLVVFGKRHIVFWSDGQGTALGLNPTFIAVTDVLEGTGCVTQWSIQAVGETDLLFLSRNGVQSLARLVSERSNPVTNLTKYVRDELRFRLADADNAQIRSAYSPENGFYLLSFPDQSITWCLDQRRRYIDDDRDFLSIITTWDLAPTAWLTRDNGTLHTGGMYGVGTYGGSDDNGSSFRFIYESPWLDLGEDVANRLKMLKRIGTILFVKNNTDIVFKWNVDFDDGFRSLTRSVSADASAEFGVGEWGAAEWSGGLTLRILKVPARNRGQYFRVAIEADVNGDFAIQQMELFTKIGRIA